MNERSLDSERTVVWATIVTHNRLDALKECITALRNQTRQPDKILVVNNGSTDGTEAWLTLQNGIEFVTQGNTGSAGGQYTALKTGYEGGADWLWTMDDDGHPDQECLDRLMRAGQRGFHYVASNLLDERGRSHFEKVFNQTRTSIVNFRGGPFNAVLLSRRLLKSVGYPMKVFFIWGDETEYTNRVIESGFPVVTVKEAIHHHCRTLIDYRNSTRGFYLVRNGIYCYRLYSGIFRERHLYLMGRLLTTFTFVARCLLHLNFREARAAASGFAHGWRDSLREAQNECCWWGLEGAGPK